MVVDLRIIINVILRYFLIVLYRLYINDVIVDVYFIVKYFK